jgi:hypothetical protein
VGQDGTCFASKKRNKIMIIIKIKEDTNKNKAA